MRIRRRIQQAERRAYPADKTHIRILPGKAFNGGKRILQHLPVRDKFLQVPDPISPNVEAVHHHGSDAATPDKRERFRNARRIDFRNDQYRGTHTRLAGTAQRRKRLFPGARKARK